MSKPFCYLLRVRYGECDAQQVVFNSRYLEYVDVAMTEFTRVLWGNYSELLARGFDNQVVAANLGWKSPARFDDVLAIYVSLEQAGNTSYSLRCEIMNHGSGAEVASVIITYVLVDASTLQKTPLTDELRGALEKGAPGVVVDHAGTVSQSAPT